MNTDTFFFELEDAIGKVDAGFFEKYWIYIVIVSLILFFALGYFLLKKKKEIKISPYELAKVRLGTVKNLHDDDKKYSSVISGLLRDYIEAVHNVPLSKRTTEEFLNMAKTLEILSDESKEKIASILRISDKAKFAKENLSENERVEILNLAEEFVETDNKNLMEKKK